MWLWERESKSLAGRYKGHSDFVKAVICSRISGKDVRINNHYISYSLEKGRIAY